MEQKHLFCGTKIKLISYSITYNKVENIIILLQNLDQNKEQRSNKQCKGRKPGLPSGVVEKSCRRKEKERKKELVKLDR